MCSAEAGPRKSPYTASCTGSLQTKLSGLPLHAAGKFERGKYGNNRYHHGHRVKRKTERPEKSERKKDETCNAGCRILSIAGECHCDHRGDSFFDD
nr:hypothetical protein CFP56_41351 [Quercus suber]